MPSTPHAIGSSGWLHLAVFGVVLPWLATRSARALPSVSQRPRKGHFRSVLVVQGVALLISLRVAAVEGIALFPRTVPPPLALGLGAVMVVGCTVALRPRWREAVARREPRVHFVMPRDAGERRLWAGVSLAAAVSEEVTYRGVMYALLLRLTHDPLTAAVATAALFGAAHAVQGARGVLAIGAISLGLQGLVLLAGSLYVAMAVHLLYDLIAGFAYGRLGEELGYPVDGIPPRDAHGAGPEAGPASR
ncbi:MAG: CPBP family intramembrane metalloprotease [Gemmatimonadales bacterium]|nr:CPBP family intramembrane metalloprotease [Gemmatimonadales bacterium]